MAEKIQPSADADSYYFVYEQIKTETRAVLCPAQFWSPADSQLKSTFELAEPATTRLAAAVSLRIRDPACWALGFSQCR